MTDYLSQDDACQEISQLIGKDLQYGILHEPFGLYDFGFGHFVETDLNKGTARKLCEHTLHASCRFKIVQKAGRPKVNRYDENTTQEQFLLGVQELLGLKVKRVALSNKNDLWIDLEKYWMVFATFENNQESWRFFTPDGKSAHMVVANSYVCLEP